MIYKKINLDDLPRNKNGHVDWKHSAGCSISFTYGDVSGIIQILEYNKGKLTIEYNGKLKEIEYSHLRELKIADLVGYKTYDYIYNIGDIVFSRDGDEGMIINRIYLDGERRYVIKCAKCGEEFLKREYELYHAKGGWCPVCCNKTHKKVRVGVNDIWTTDPDIAEQLFDPNDGYKYVIGTNTKLMWKCKYCGEPHSVTAMPRTIIEYSRRIVPCRRCGDGISYPNKFVYNVLKECGVNFKPEQVFPWSNGRRYDFNLIDLHIICEINGVQHYDSSKFGHNGRDDKSIDSEKYNLAMNNGYMPDEYIVIDARVSNSNYIMESIKNTRLAELIDLSAVDCSKIEQLCRRSIFDDVIQGVRDGKNAYQIAEETKYADISVYRYIRLGEELGIISYDREKFNDKRLDTLTKLNRQRCSKPIMCVDTGHVFMSSGILDEESEAVFGERMVRSCVTDSINKDCTYKNHEWKFITRQEFNDYKRRFPDKAFGDFFINAEIDAA